MRKFFPDYLLVLLKGIAMGAADVVPGVSGGTIAFISGIYQELIDSINNVNFSAFKNIRKIGIQATWAALNGNFLIALLIGIFISILSLSKLITHLLSAQPILVWSFFFGLVLASILLIWKEITVWKPTTIMMLVLGVILSYYITIAKPVASPDSLPYLFLSGFLAIIAMILPGVSGAFILLLMGSYQTVIGTLNEFREALLTFNLAILVDTLIKLTTFAFGAILGLKLFSKILHWMFLHHKNRTLAVLIGFMIGSLNKIWPWKKVLETRTNSHGEVIPFLEKSIFPNNYDGNPKLLTAILLILLGFLLIFTLEKLAHTTRKKKLS